MLSLLQPLLSVDYFRSTGEDNSGVWLPPEILITILESILYHTGTGPLFRRWTRRHPLLGVDS